MGWFIVSALGAATFGALGLTTGWKIGWGGLFAFSPVFLTALAALYWARPHGGKDCWQLASRVCWPLALAALAEVFLKLEKTFGFLGFTLSLMAQIAVWGSVVLTSATSLYELIVRRRGWNVGAPIGGSPAVIVFRFLDWWQNLPAEHLQLGPGDAAMLVREQSLWDSVYPALFSRGAISLLIGAVAGFTLAAAAFLWQGAQQLLAEEILQGLRFEWWLIPTIPLVLTVPVLVWTYLIAEWERRHFRYVFCLGQSAVVRAGFNLAGATEFRSDGPTTEIAEVKRASPGEKPGSESRSFWGRQRDAVLLRVARVQDVHIPSRYLGAADWLQAVGNAPGFCLALNDVVGRAKKAKALKDAFAHAANDARVEDALRSSGWSGATGDSRADQILQAYAQTAGEGGGTIDLWTVADPGLYHRVTGEPIQKAASTIGSTAVLVTFPEEAE